MITKKNQATPDIIVVGGGAAGMMAAGRAAERGKKVIIVEKTHRLGNKLLLTGGGRCNITNKVSLKEFINAFGKNGKFLYRAFTVFSNRDLINFFSSRGLEMRVDPDGKVFPADHRARSVLAVLRQYIDDHQVRILHNTVVTNILFQSGESLRAGGVRCADHSTLDAGKVIVAAGGMSYPKTGSSGDGYKLARQCGHSIVPLTPGLVALESDEPFLQELQGIALKDISLSVLVDGKKKGSEKGDILFTHFGVSGPTVLILSGIVIDALAAGRSVALSLQLRPADTAQELDPILQREFESRGTITLSRYLKEALPKSFALVFEHRCAVEPGKRCSKISREERKRIVLCFKDFRINITKPRPIEEATITRGGVSLEEINPRTLESRIVHGLFFCGEMIDVDGMTGGYNLQAAFSTGYLAGESAVSN
ncbi:MAG: NAD(P)/FAD-dependent oxidoreductase [Deltaproteobacteria bacterium]|nr:NAD(P)/FAD-dependent oxidoreductase [Deltaproteobacteria bacterium]